MTNETIVRAWKDASFRATLEPDAVPEHPAGTSTVKAERLQSAKCTTASPMCSCKCE